MRWIPGCNCCAGGCFVFTDTFARDNDPTSQVGPDWNEVRGDWGIENDQLVERYVAESSETSEDISDLSSGGFTGDTSGGIAGVLIICTRPVPMRSQGEMYVTIKVPKDNLEDGDTFYLYPACPDTKHRGPVCVQYEWFAATSTEGSKWKTTICFDDDTFADYETSAEGFQNDYFTLVACCDFSIGMVRGWVSPTVNEEAAWMVTDPGTGRYAGVGHNNPLHLNIFEDFNLLELRTETELCQPCFCQCEEYTPGPRLRATIVWPTFRAGCLGTSTWDMDYVQGPQEETWEGGITIEPETDRPGADNERMNWRLTCGSGGLDFNLIWMYPLHCQNNLTPRWDEDDDRCEISPGVFGPCGNTGDSIQHSATIEGSTCDPFRLIFGPFFIDFSMPCFLCYDPMAPDCVMPPYSDYCWGAFYIEITED